VSISTCGGLIHGGLIFGGLIVGGLRYFLIILYSVMQFTYFVYTL
jgi:hypothetical protein